MVVTADAQGDYNATSQILRYSALAREVTAPRALSYTPAMLPSGPRPGTACSGRSTPSVLLDDLDTSSTAIARLTAELEVFTVRLREETLRRKAAEASWAAAEEHMADLEQSIRDECYLELETAVSQERRRWQAALDSEADNAQAHLDSKIDVVIRATQAHMRSNSEATSTSAVASSNSVNVYEDPAPGLAERVDDLERENEALRAKCEALEREAHARSASPVKKMRVLKAKRWEDPEMRRFDFDD
jgi:chromosome segregation ATPase